MFEQAIILNTQLAVSILPPSGLPLLVTPMLTASTFIGSDIVRADIDWYPEEGVVALTLSSPGEQSLGFLLDGSASSTHELLHAAASSNSILVGGALSQPADCGMTISAGITEICEPVLAWLRMPRAHAGHNAPATFIRRALALDFLVSHGAVIGQADGRGTPEPIRLNVVLGPEHLAAREVAAAQDIALH